MLLQASAEHDSAVVAILDGGSLTEVVLNLQTPLLDRAAHGNATATSCLNLRFTVNFRDCWKATALFC